MLKRMLAPMMAPILVRLSTPKSVSRVKSSCCGARADGGEIGGRKRSHAGHRKGGVVDLRCAEEPRSSAGLSCEGAPHLSDRPWGDSGRSTVAANAPSPPEGDIQVVRLGLLTTIDKRRPRCAQLHRSVATDRPSNADAISAAASGRLGRRAARRVFALARAEPDVRF
jgi:hypothetical protein